MSKKMKGVALDPSPYGGYVDARARFKHQALMQDYQDLRKETEATRNKLEIMKQRKLTLLAEVRFLRRRYKYLMKNKAATKLPRGREVVQPQKFETKHKRTMKGKTYNRKEANLRNLAPVFDLNQKDRIISAKDSARRNPSRALDLNLKDRIHSGKEATLTNTVPVFDLNQKENAYGVKVAAFRLPTPILTLNQKERLYVGDEIMASQNPAPTFDLNQMGRPYIGREDAVQNRAPTFDLNQISGEEEEELQENYEPLRIIKEPMKNMVRGGGTDEQQHNDLKLSACRNIGNGANRAAGKRKISWQDQVALKV